MKQLVDLFLSRSSSVTYPSTSAPHKTDKLFTADY